MPEGSKARRLVRFARLSQRDGERYAILVKQHWAAWGISGRAHSYQWWLQSHRPSRRELARQRRSSRRWSSPISIGVVLLWDHGPASTASATIHSLQRQTWDHWRAAVPEAIAAEFRDDERVVAVADDASTADVIQTLRLEPRDFLMFLEPGDRVVASALFQIARAPWRNPMLDLVYWDDDELDRFGLPHHPRFRPEWSPETLLGANFVGRSFAMRARRYTQANGRRAELGDATWWDLLLRSGLTAERAGLRS